LLAQGWWFSPGTPASSTTKTGRHDIAEILLKAELNTKIQIQICLCLLLNFLHSISKPLSVLCLNVLQGIERMSRELVSASAIEL
jgi:hypothetical protein